MTSEISTKPHNYAKINENLSILARPGYHVHKNIRDPDHLMSDIPGEIEEANETLAFLKENGFRRIIALNSRKIQDSHLPKIMELCEHYEIRLISLHVEDHIDTEEKEPGRITREKVAEFLGFMDSTQKTAVHCGAGVGRSLGLVAFNSIEHDPERRHYSVILEELCHTVASQQKSDKRKPDRYLKEIIWNGSEELMKTMYSNRGGAPSESYTTKVQEIHKKLLGDKTRRRTPLNSPCSETRPPSRDGSDPSRQRLKTPSQGSSSDRSWRDLSPANAPLYPPPLAAVGIAAPRPSALTTSPYTDTSPHSGDGSSSAFSASETAPEGSSLSKMSIVVVPTGSGSPETRRFFPTPTTTPTPTPTPTTTTPPAGGRPPLAQSSSKTPPPRGWGIRAATPTESPP